MKYNGNINYVKCLEFGLNLSQGAVMDLIGHLPTWAEGKEIEGKIYYYLSTSKMIKELPIISEKRGTFLKILQVLKEKGLLNHKLLENKGWYNLTEKGKSFFTKIFDEKYQEEQEKQGVENFTHSNESVEKNTHKCVKKYTQGVEKNTHNNNTSNNNTEYNKKNNNSKELLLKKARENLKKYGEYENVKLTEEEVERLKADYGLEIFEKYLKILDEGIEMKGYKYKNHNLAFRKWLEKDNVKKVGEKKVEFSDYEKEKEARLKRLEEYKKRQLN